jgi:antitoxin component YwqK of YwqJK toxin-antitoxin module
MQRIRYSLVGAAALIIASCQNHTTFDQVVSQKYVHKYGFDVSEQEWEERAQDGQEISMLKNGVKVTRSYQNGQLSGPTTHTFPHSSTVEKLLVYDQGTLLKETVYDLSGMPIREDLYEFDDRNIITLWDEKGVPLSIEEYNNDLLMEGKYYTAEHILEAQVEAGFGERIKRDRTGLLLSKDRMEDGHIAERTTYHPTGEMHAISRYDDYQLHGEQLKFTSTGKPLMKLNWQRGILNGPKVVYRNGLKVAEIPYVNGQKNGIEKHYDDLDNLTAEIEWKNDKKHGSCKFYTDETTDTEWYYKGQTVNADKFQMLENREKLVAELSIER